MIAYFCFWCPHKLVFLQDLNESHLNVHESKSHSNAVARAPAKRHVAYSRALCLLLRSEPEEGGERWRVNQGGRKEENSTFLGQISLVLAIILECVGGGGWGAGQLFPWEW